MACLVKRKGADGQSVYWIDFRYQGRRIRRSTMTGDKELAKKILDTVKGKLANDKFRLEDYEDRNISLRDFYSQYIEHCKLTKRSGSAEIDDYALKDFVTVVGGSRSMRSISESDFRTFLIGMKESRFATSTINRKLRAVKTAFNWAMIGDRRWIDVNVGNQVKPLKEEEIAPRFLTLEELRKLLTHIAEDPDNERGKHFGRYVFTLLNTGCRRSEALRLTWEDVDFNNRFVRFLRTKTGKFRYVPLNDELYGILMTMRNELPVVSESQMLFPWRDDYATHRFARYVKSAKLSSRIHLHCLRHTTAVMMRLSGVPISEIKDTLGHSKVATTEIYNRVTPEHLREHVAMLGFSRIRDAKDPSLQLPPAQADELSSI